MLYLIRSFGRGGKSILKIGYTEDINRRINQYFYYSPGFELITTREGDELLEDMIQMYLKFLGYQFQKDGRLNEWFIDNFMISQIFHIHRKRLEKKLWINRDKIFDLSKTVDFKIFTYLKERNPNTFRGYNYRILEGNNIIPISAKDIDVKFQSKLINRQEIVIEKEDDIFGSFLDTFYNTKIFSIKLKNFCEFMDLHKDDDNILKFVQDKIPDPKFLNYYNFFGTKVCKSKKYCEETLKHMLFDAIGQDSLRSRIISEFNLNERYTRKNIKERLTIIYKTHGISKTPKANDIEEYFETRPAKITDTATGKRDHGYELLALKKN